jgi:VCBS repeat protein/ASPIC/UnbV protein
VDPSTREMGALLTDLASRVNPRRMPFQVDDRRAELLAEDLAWPRPVIERLQLRFSYASSLLRAGKTMDSLAAMDALQEDTTNNAPGRWEIDHNVVELLRATAYMRLGEELNCHLANNRDSCLLPIRGEGVHRQREGATRAIEVLKRILDEEPENLQARWLLNVAHMTLGSYPDGVSKRDLIPPGVFAAEEPFPAFENVAAQVGVDQYGLAGGAVLDDFDNDGRLDLMVSHSGFEEQTRLLWNRGDGAFDDRTERAGLVGEMGGLNMIQADYDNDGFVDVVVLRGGWMGPEVRFPLSLLRNKGDGRFTDVTKAAGLLAHLAPTQTATWLDYDGDGWLDLFVGNETRAGGFEEASPCELFHNNRDGTFTNVAPESGVDFVGFVKGVVSGDYNNDGRPDVFVSVQGSENLLFRNDGPSSDKRGWRFTNVSKEASVTEPLNSFGASFFDFDNDGWPDLFVAGWGGFDAKTMAADVAADYLGLPTSAERGRLYRNRGDGTFEDVTKAAGLYRVVPAMGLNFGDLDNDGLLDLYLGTGNPDFGTLIPNRMFRNDGRSFRDVTTAGNFGHLQKGHGIAFGDIDNDGDQDVFEEMGGAFLADKAYSALYLNPGAGHHWLRLELEGVRSNRSAIGARIKVELKTENGTRYLYRTVGSGGSFGCSPLRAEIGLGRAKAITAVEVFWPATGRVQTVTRLALDRGYRVREDAAAAVEVVRPTFKIKTVRRGPPSPGFPRRAETRAGPGD